MYGNFKRDFHQCALFQFLRYKLTDDAGHSQADFGKFNEQVHGGYLQYIVVFNVMQGQIVVNILPGNVFFIHKHKG